MKKGHLYLFRRSLFFKVLPFLFIIVLCSQGFGQSLGDYQSSLSGDWTSLTTWQRYNGTDWLTPTAGQGYPGQLAGTGSVLIQSSHVVTIPTPIGGVFNTQQMGAITIASSGQLYLEGSNTTPTFNLSTPEINVIAGPPTGTIYFFNRAKLALPFNAVIFVGLGGIIGDCNANQQIWIGNQLYAQCSGNGQSEYTFEELMGLGGSLNAEATSDSPQCEGYGISLFGNFAGVYGTTTPGGAPGVNYEWHINGPGYSATETDQNTSIPSYAVSGDYVVDLTVSTWRGTSLMTNSENIIVSILDGGNWYGNVNTDWSEVGNWCGGIPTNTTDVIIQANALYMPTVDLLESAPAECNNLTIEPEASLIVDPGKALSVNGTLTNDAGNSGLIIKANSSGEMGSLIHNTAYVDATVEQYLTSERWHMVSPPISNATINVYFDIYLKEYNEPDNSWTTLVLPTTIPMNETQGYYTWVEDDWLPPSNTVSYEGELNTGSFNIADFTYNPSTNPTYYGFNLVGNPYPCALDWNADTSWFRLNMSGWMVIQEDGTFKGWNPHLPGSESWNGMTSGIIPSTQGFWVRATNLPAFMVIPESQRLHNSQTFYKNTNENPFPAVRLNVEKSGLSDETIIIFHPEGNIGFDGLYDLTKFMNVEDAPTLYTIVEGENYAVNIYKEEYQDVVIPVGFTTGEEGMYTITAPKIENFIDATNVYLEDLITGTVINLKETPQYEFSHNPLNDAIRFNLHFKDSWYGIKDKYTGNISIYSAEDYVYIITSEMQSGDVFIYNMLGQEILNQRIGDSDLSKIRVTTGSAYYLVKFQSDEILVTEKVFIK